MKFDFYLSEMSVSDQHGGGLTLQRILGDDLKQIDRFIHVNRFAADLPARGEFLNRSTDLLSLWQSDFIRKVIGRSLAAKISNKVWMIKLHAGSAAKKISQIFADKEQIIGLICPQGANAIFTLEALKKIKKVQYITWVMDDHLISYQNGAWQYPEGTERVFAQHLRDALHVFVISPAMQKFYKEQFGVDSTVLFGSSDSVGLKMAEGAKSGALRIGYFGAVAAWQKDALKAVSNALSGSNAQLYIYSGIDKLPAELMVDEVHFKGSVGPDKVLAEMQSYDAVLLPISFQQKIRNMSEFNIATKMSEYLACGVPILAVGPPYAAMMNFLQDSNAAVTVPSNQQSDIKDGIEQLRNNQRTDQILKNARELTKSQVGSEPMRAVWQRVMGGH